MSKKQSLVGMRFNEWTVLTDPVKGRCICECSCGVKRNVLIGGIKLGKSKSCGHAHRDDLTGRQFGEWTVISKTLDYNYLCKCSCGVERVYNGGQLRNGLVTNNCGHVKENMLLNGKFGEWTVIRKYDSSHYLCKCSCGNIRAVNVSSLMLGKSKSCGHHARTSQIKPGTKIKEWTVLERTPERKYLCRCSCGIERKLNTSEILNNQADICIHTPDLIGHKFGTRTVLNKARRSYWTCKCDCGNIEILTRRQLMLTTCNKCNTTKGV